MAAPRIASLFTGTGALDLAVEEVFGGHTVWHCQYDPEDRHQYAARICAAHWPGVPNLGDITAVDWHQVREEHGPVDILTGGFPCTDLSLAGQQAGIAEGTRSGLWLHMARAISILRPSLVVIENVRGLLSAPAHSDVEPCSWCLGDGDGEPPLRALGAVLGDLADLGFDAEWVGRPASADGAPHERWREFVLAWPAAADAANVGHEWGGAARDRWPGPADGGDAAADPEGVGHGHAGPAGERGIPAAPVAGGTADRCSSTANASGGRRDRVHERDEQRHVASRPGEDGAGIRASAAPGETQWGAYEPAIRRWEYVLGRYAPSPVDALGRLSPAFVEWMMGLPDGWFMDVPGPEGMTAAALRNARLKAGGNGVVRQQAVSALRILAGRMPEAALRRLYPLHEAAA